MNYDTQCIEKILKLSDDSVEVTDIDEIGTELIANVQKSEAVCFCEKCGQRMVSKGPRYRTVRHQILQDGRTLLLNVKTRKWHCNQCDYYAYDQFNFVSKFKQTSNLTILMILDQMKDLGKTARQIALSLNVSDTYVHESFMQYVDLPRLSLCRVLCIDEVYLKFDKENLYSVVLMNWETSEIIDILPNRFKETLDSFFRKISKAERYKVEYLVSDMYDTYAALAGPGSWLGNAKLVIDTFHHTQPIINSIQSYIYKVRKKYAERDRKKLDEENYKNNRNFKTRKDSREVYLLKNYDYFLLKNHDDINYSSYYRHIRGRHGYYVYPSQLEKEFMELDKNFQTIRDQKEKYIHFTHSHTNDPEGAEKELDELITFYRSSELYMFREFAETLNLHREGIISSFTFLKAERITQNDDVLHRISTGPLESFMNVPKDYKRQSNGVRNFRYTRNRILWATRKNPAMKAIPYEKEEIHTPGKKRGSYRKN